MIDVTNESDWEVSGTFGQWDATESYGGSAGKWELTGGFWSVAITETDYLFSDSFENSDFSG